MGKANDGEGATYILQLRFAVTVGVVTNLIDDCIECLREVRGFVSSPSPARVVAASLKRLSHSLVGKDAGPINLAPMSFPRRQTTL